MQRPRDVLGRARPEIGKLERQPVAYLLMHNMRDADAVRLCHGFEPRRDVDPVAVNVVGFYDDVAEMDADAKADPLCLGDCGVAVVHAALHLDRAQYGFDNAGKFGQETVAGVFDDAPMVLANFGIDEFVPIRHQAAVDTGLVGLHQARIARHVGGNDCGEVAGGHGTKARIFERGVFLNRAGSKGKPATVCAGLLSTGFGFQLRDPRGGIGWRVLCGK